MNEKKEFSHTEIKAENRENREEKQLDQELKAAAAMERADFLSREVKSSQKQIQNIVLHMQQVIATIKQLRAQLDLPVSNDASSLEEDARRVEKLKEQIRTHRSELDSMREQLISEQVQLIVKDNPDVPIAVAEMKAQAKVKQLYIELDS